MIESWVNSAVPTPSTSTPNKEPKIDIAKNREANHKNNRGLQLKVSCLEKNVAYYKAEVTAAEYKYEIMKNKLKHEKKSHRRDNAANEAKIASLSQQMSFLMAHSGAANTAAGIPAISNPINLLPFQPFAQVPATTHTTLSHMQ